ncbi:hypothetical protein [Halomonas mongoliensis]|uniref:hypothetical protein n=1 Tax=Halomonas mongoliensis TaxID=321265 RepID=UPI00403B257E
MSQHDDKRRKLLGRLGRQLAYTAPVLALVAGGVTLHATVGEEDSSPVFSTLSAISLLFTNAHAEAHAEGGAEAQGEAEAEAEAEGEAEAEAEGEAEAEAEGEAEAEAEGEAEAGDTEAVSRPAGYEPAYSETGENPTELLARGEVLYYDTSLSTNGLSCATCHGSDGQDMGYNPTFEEAFPHRVAMAENQFGMSEVHADEMVQICMVAPMQASPLDWGGEALPSLSAYMVEVQRRYTGQPHDL